MAKILKIRYTMVDGFLPNGMKLNPDTGLIEGSTGFDAVSVGPVWTGPAVGSLGSYDEGQAFTQATFSATSNKGPLTFSLATTNDKLPWGLRLNPVNGTITGTIAPLKLRTKEEGVTLDGPTWNTAFGKLAGYDEGFVSSISLSATPKSSRTLKGFEIIEGALPWGLKLNPQTGVISGTVGRLKNPGAFVDVPKLPLPEWNTPVDLGTYNELETVTSGITAAPASGRSMSKYVIIGGALPWGLKMNLATGAITGTLTDMLKRNEVEYVDLSKMPVINDNVVINGTSTLLTNGGSLGTFWKSNPFTATVTATPVSGRTISAYFIKGNLPFGLKITPATGQISGTISSKANVGTYTFTVCARDSGFYVASRQYSITVTDPRDNSFMRISNNALVNTSNSTLVAGGTAPTITNGEMIFTGTQRIKYTDGSSLRATNPLSVEFEFKAPTASAVRVIMSLGQTTNIYPELQFEIGSTNIMRALSYTDSTNSSTRQGLDMLNPIVANTWYKIGYMVYNDGQGLRQRAYLNDVLFQDIGLSQPWDSTAGFTIGMDNAGASPFTGSIRNLYISKTRFWY